MLSSSSLVGDGVLLSSSLCSSAVWASLSLLAALYWQEEPGVTRDGLRILRTAEESDVESIAQNNNVRWVRIDQIPRVVL